MSELTKWIYVAVISMVPLIELRGAIPVAAGFGLDVFWSYIVAVLANCLPIPFILLLARPVIRLLKKIKCLSWIADKLEEKAEKNREKFEKRSAIAIFAFVAIPLPGTGAWSGCIIASILGISNKRAIPAVAAGVAAAGLIMSLGAEFVKLIIRIF